MTSARFLTAADIAADLRVSKREAYRLMRQMGPFVNGNTIRVSTENYVAHIGSLLGDA